MRAAVRASHLWLGVWQHSPRAIRFYEKNGFVDRQIDPVMIVPVTIR